ncbi:MAG: CorA family divalent cation transporter, partial [Nitrososphaera sp.]
MKQFDRSGGILPQGTVKEKTSRGSEDQVGWAGAFGSGVGACFGEIIKELFLTTAVQGKIPHQNQRQQTMSRYIKKRSKKVGLPPGTLVHIGEKKTDKVRITLIEYDEGRFQEKDLATITDWIPVKNGSTVSWLDVGGIHQLDLIEQIGNKFDLHPLLLEDIVNTDQRPKLEEYGAYLYVVLKMLYVGDKRNQIVAEQVSIVHGPAFVLSFQENGGDVFNSVRDRLKTSKGLIRKLGADYLVYALVDAIVDSYFTILEGLGESVELLEEDLVANPTPRTLHGIHALKRDML